ncbi:hypothetical protein [Caulobacter segnis]
MPDIAKAKRNVSRMIDGGASEQEIDTYLSSEGLSAAELRSAPSSPPPQQAPRGVAYTNPVENFVEPVAGAWRNVAGKFGSMLDARTPQEVRSNRGPGIGDLAGLITSPLAGVQNVVTKPMAQGVVNSGLQAYQPRSLADGVKDIFSGRAPAPPRKLNGQEAVQRINTDIGAALAGAMPARGSVGLAGPQVPQGYRPPPKVKAPTSDAQILKSVGVQTTIPQRMGPGAKKLEDLAARAPVMETAISGARARQVEQLNRGVALKALEPVGGKIPKDVKPGFDMVQHVDDELSKVYDQAIKMVPAPVADQDLANDFASIGQRSIDLTDESANLYDRAINNRLGRLQQPGLTGEKVKDIHSELGQLQGAAARRGDETLADMFGDARRAVMGLIQRSDPVAGELISKADKGWSVYKIMNKAAASASNRGGVFLPGQLNTQVRASANLRGVNVAGRGQGQLQDIATAASRMIPDSYGNPGTANALMTQGGIAGLGALATKEPALAATIAAGVGGAATPYFLSARKIIETLPASASQAQVAQAQGQLAALAKFDPKIVVLQEYLAQVPRSGASAPLAMPAAAQEQQQQ